MDATINETQKLRALYAISSPRPFSQHLWAKQGLIVHSEFRDSRVPVG